MRLRTATLNAWALPEPLGQDVPQRMRALGARLPQLDLDVLSLQEVWSPEARSTLVAAGRAAGLAHAWHGRGPLGPAGGLLVLSRLPILEARFERFTLPGRPPRADHLDYYAGKGFASLRLDTGQGPLTLIGTHLHARYGSEVPHEYHAYRVGQIVQIASHLWRVDGPAVVTGDFNLREDTTEYRILSGLTGLRDVAVELDRREPTVYGGHPYRLRRRGGKRIDYVLLRNGREASIWPLDVARAFDDVFEIDGRAASYSDHAGLVADLSFAPGVGETPSAPAPEALRLASAALDQGRRRSGRLRSDDRLAGGVGLAGALALGAATRTRPLSRRRLLRVGFQGAALLALAPALGFSVLSEVYAPDELRAFEDLAARLERWRTEPSWLLAGPQSEKTSSSS